MPLIWENFHAASLFLLATMNYTLRLLLLLLANVTYSQSPPSSATTKGPKGSEPQTSTQDTTPAACDRMYLEVGSLSQGGRWQDAYDTAKTVVEQCHGIMKTHGMFSYLTGSNSMRNNDPNRYPEHLQWLKKVLYYDPDSVYYCADVYGMVGALQYFDSLRGNYYEGKLSIVLFMRDSAHCGHRYKLLDTTAKTLMAALYEKWRDTVTDSTATPFNPHIPSLEELDLTILRGPQHGSAPMQDPRIGSIAAYPNPVANEVTLSYTLAKSALVRIDVFDPLGRSVYASGEGFKQQGNHSLTLSAGDWTAGAYYIRLSTPSGEVRTVKVIKE